MIIRMMKIPRTDKVEEVLKKCGVKRKLICELIIRQLKFMGHFIRKEGFRTKR